MSDKTRGVLAWPSVPIADGIVELRGLAIATSSFVVARRVAVGATIMPMLGRLSITPELLALLLAKHATEKGMINDDRLDDVVIDGAYDLVAMARELSASFVPKVL